MFCPYCGKEFKNGIKFCPHCGKEVLSGASSKPIGNDVKSAKKEPKNKPPQKPTDWLKRKKAAFSAVITTAVVLILSVVIAAGSLVHFFLSEDAFDNQKLDLPARSEQKEPTYNLSEMIKKLTSNMPALGSPATDEQLSVLTAGTEAVIAAVNSGESSAAGKYSELNENTRYDYISEVSSKIYELYRNNAIQDYYTSEAGVEVTLNDGSIYMYVPEVEGFDGSGADGALKVATYQPCVSGYGSTLSSYMEMPDEKANLISSTLLAYSFENTADYDDKEVDLSALSNFAGYHVILWHGHGGYTQKVGSFMVTGIEYNAENDRRYYTLIKENAFIKTSSGHYAISAEFINHNFDDNAFENSIIYLGTCSSGLDNRLAEAFLNKGASAVYANSNTIHTTYNLSMLNSVVDGLCKTYDNGGSYTVSDALLYAKAQNGNCDTAPNYTTVNLYAPDESFSLDWYEDCLEAQREVVLLLDSSGSMSGTPINETKEAATKFVNSVLEQQATVSIVTYSGSASIKNEFTRRHKALQNSIDNIHANGTTNIDDALSTAHNLLKDGNAEKKIILLMSDGLPNEGRVDNELIALANSIRSDGIYIYTLGFFNDLSDAEKSDAQSLMEAIADPGSHYEVENADELEFFFEDIALEINGERRIYIRIACPVDVEIKCDGETLSKKNPRTSFGTLTYENTLSADGTELKESSRVKVLRLKEGADYDVKIEGTGAGTMDYKIGFMDENGEYNDFRTFKDVKITKKTVIDTKASYTKTTILNVDQDGDGEYDLYYKAAENSRGDIVEEIFPIQLKIAIISGSIALLSAVVFIIALKQYKKLKVKAEAVTA